MSQASSIKASVIRWVAEAFPQLFYAVPRSYVVTKANGDGTLNLAPPPSSPNLPPLANVPQWSLGGATVTPQLGALVVVLYLDVAHSPVAVGMAPSLPTATTVDASAMTIGPSASSVAMAKAAGPSMRYGDTVAFTGTVVPGAGTGTLAGVFTFTPSAPPFDVVSKVKT